MSKLLASYSAIIQGVVTPIGAVLTAETGDTTRSPAHGGFSFRSLGHYGFSSHLMILWRAGLQHSTRDYTAVMHRGHRFTSDFKVWLRGHSRILVDTNCVPGLSRKYRAYGSDHPLIICVHVVLVW